MVSIAQEGLGLLSPKIVLGMPLIGDKNWSGGLNYQRSILQLASGVLSDKLKVRLIVPEHQRLFAEETFSEYLTEPVIVYDPIKGAGRGRRIFSSLFLGNDSSLSACLAEHDIDVFFESARFLGWRFSTPVLTWIPDFQHRYLPELFAWRAWWRREIGFRMQMFGRRIILLSSETARQDCEKFYPRSRNRTAVVRFSKDVDIAAVVHHASSVQVRYGLPFRYIYMPNQFWSHKNHRTVVDALVSLRDRCNIEQVPIIVMSGLTLDHRSVGLFEQTMKRAADEGVSPWFIHLGSIPYSDVLALNLRADAVLNPSLFEGWASSVEEAKALGSTLVLSDIPVHREQAPGAKFFNPLNSATLSGLLQEVYVNGKREQPRIRELQVANDQRAKEFAANFFQAVCRAYALGKESGDRL